MDHNNQLSLHSRIVHMFVNLNIVISFSFNLTGYGFKILSQSYNRVQYIYTQNDSARISYKLSYRQQIKDQILTLLSSVGQYLGLIYF